MATDHRDMHAVTELLDEGYVAELVLVHLRADDHRHLDDVETIRHRREGGSSSKTLLSGRRLQLRGA